MTSPTATGEPRNSIRVVLIDGSPSTRYCPIMTRSDNAGPASMRRYTHTCVPNGDRTSATPDGAIDRAKSSW
jgi:hypothetical protein